MTEILLLVATFGALGILAIFVQRRLRVISVVQTPTCDRQFESPEALLRPPATRWTGTRRRAHPPLARIAAGELMVLTTAYLCAVQEGDLDRKTQILGTVSGWELLAGLSLVSHTLAAEHGDATGMNTTSVLNEMYANAVSRHRETIVLA